MLCIPPLAVTELNLTATNVTEPFAPSNYNAGTGYAAGDFVTNDADKLVYRSLRDANTGNDPAVADLWWEVVGPKEVAYNPATTYAASTDAARVYVHFNHRNWESLQGSNTGKTPGAFPDYWQDAGPSLRYAMFDTIRNTASVRATPLEVTVTPGARVDCLAVLGVDAETVRVTMTADGVTVYDQTISLVTRQVFTYYDYFFTPLSQKVAHLFRGLPPYTGAVIDVTFSKSAGSVKCGALVMGKSSDLGITTRNAENDAQNFSEMSRDPFGNAVLIPRRAAPQTSQLVKAEPYKVAEIMALRARINAVPCVWAGIKNSDSPYFPPLLILGYWRRFRVALPGPGKAEIALDLEEV